MNRVDTIPVDMVKSFIDDVAGFSWPLSYDNESSETPSSNFYQATYAAIAMMATLMISLTKSSSICSCTDNMKI